MTDKANVYSRRYKGEAQGKGKFGKMKAENVKQETAKKETKHKIVDAFWNLYRTTSIEKITVKKITDACGIYRTTFYLHFADVYAILEEIEADLLKDMRDITAEVRSTAEEREDLMKDIQRSLVKNYEYLRVLLDGTHDPIFTGEYKKEMVKRMCVGYGIDPASLDDCSAKIIQVTFSTLIDMLMNLLENPELTYERVAKILSGYMQNGIINTIKDLANIR